MRQHVKFSLYLKMKIIRYIISLKFICCGILIGKEITIRGGAETVVANGNTIQNIESEIIAFNPKKFLPEGREIDFTKAKIVLLGGDEKLKRSLTASENLLFECTVETDDEMVEEKSMLLEEYVTLRFRGLSAFNTSRVISEIAGNREKIRPEDMVQFPIVLLQKIDNVPEWIRVYYINKEFDLNGDIYCLPDNDIVWLFMKSDEKAVCICGYDGKHRNLAGFQAAFDKIVSRIVPIKTLDKSDSKKIANEISKEFNLSWLSPSEIPRIFN